MSEIYVVSGIAVRPHDICRTSLDVQHCLFKVQSTSEVEAEAVAQKRIREIYDELEGWYSHNVLLSLHTELE